VYSIEVWQEGRAWTVRRRYSEFVSFNEELLEEALVKVMHSLTHSLLTLYSLTELL
jgi:hypothetical protein